MKWTGWMTWVGFSLMVVALLAGVAYADPTGNADVPQILLGFTFDPSPVSYQLTFLTTDPVAFDAAYYDPNPACAGIAPLFAQLFVFNLEGLFVTQVNAATGPLGTPFSSKYREIFVALSPGTLGAGSYKFTFLVRDCANTKSVVLPELLTFRVIAP